MNKKRFLFRFCRLILLAYSSIFPISHVCECSGEQKRSDFEMRLSQYISHWHCNGCAQSRLQMKRIHAFRNTFVNNWSTFASLPVCPKWISHCFECDTALSCSRWICVCHTWKCVFRVINSAKDDNTGPTRTAVVCIALILRYNYLHTYSHPFDVVASARCFVSHTITDTSASVFLPSIRKRCFIHRFMNEAAVLYMLK